MTDESGEQRTDHMREHAIYTCPTWCLQPDDEDGMEYHIGTGETVEVDDWATIHVRPARSWFAASPEDMTTTLALSVVPIGMGAVTMVEGLSVVNSVADLFFSSTEWDQLVAAVGRQTSTAQTFEPVEAEQWAYDGAQTDAADEQAEAEAQQ